MRRSLEFVAGGLPGRPIGRFVLRALLLSVCCVGALVRLALAQCPDGSLPPCGPRPPAQVRVAVLNFRNDTPRDLIAGEFATRLSAAIGDRLSLLDRLAVVPRSAIQALGPEPRSLRPAELGRRLNAEFYLVGAVRRVEIRRVGAGAPTLRLFRVNAEVVSPSTGRSKWVHQFQRPEGELDSLEQDLIVGVASALLAPLRPAERARLSRPTPVASVSDSLDPNLIAVVPFTAPRGDTVLQRVATTAAEIMALRLQDGHAPRATGADEVLAAWSRERGADTTRDRAEVDLAVARATGAALVLRGAVRRVGGQALLAATLRDVRSQQPVASRSVLVPPDSVEVLAGVLLLQVLAPLYEFAAPLHRIEWLSRRDPQAVRMYLDEPELAGAANATYWLQVLARDSLMVFPMLRGFFERDVTSGPGGGVWYDSLAAIAFQRRGGLLAEDRAFDEAMLGPMFGLADNAEARIALWQRATEAGMNWWLPWEYYAATVAGYAGMTSEPGWRGRGLAAIDRAWQVHACQSVAIIGFWFRLFVGDTAGAREIVEHESSLPAGGISELQHVLALSRGDLSDTLFWMAMDPDFVLMRAATVARAVPAAVPVADAIARWWETKPGTGELLLAAIYWRERGQRERWVRFSGLARAGMLPRGNANPNQVVADARILRQVLFLDAPVDSAVGRTVARLERIAEGESVPAPDSGAVGVARCWLSQWRLSRGDTSGVVRAIAYLRAMDARDRAGAQSGWPGGQRWAVCPAILDAQLARVTGREPLAKARALDSLVRRMPVPRRGLPDVMTWGRTHDQTRFLENLIAARLLAAAGDTALALAAARRRPVDRVLLEGFENLIDHLREEGRFAGAQGDTAGALEAYDHYLGLRMEPPDYAPWRAEWDAVRAEAAALQRRP
jgi:TolB-like protein